MQNSPLISVVMPVYNAEKYLRLCLDNVVSQTLQEIEIICVDDGSTDQSPAILREYAHRDGRFRIIEQQNCGAAAARNVGLKAAKGNYVSFLDADDLFFSDMLEEALKAADGTADVVVFGAEYFESGVGVLFEDRVKEHLLPLATFFSAEDIPEHIFQITSCNTWDKIYKREFLQNETLEYQQIKTANDLYFVCAALVRAKQIAVLDRVLIRHRVLREGNLQTVKAKTPMDFYQALSKLCHELQDKGSWTTFQRSFLNFALSHCAANYLSLAPSGQAAFLKKRKELRRFLELDMHPESYYYNHSEYKLLCRLTEEDGGKGGCIMGRIKQKIKGIFPPPVRTFLREINGLRQLISEQNAGVRLQLRQMSREQKELLTLLKEQQKTIESLAAEISEMRRAQNQLTRDSSTAQEGAGTPQAD